MSSRSLSRILRIDRKGVPHTDGETEQFSLTASVSFLDDVDRTRLAALVSARDSRTLRQKRGPQGDSSFDASPSTFLSAAPVLSARVFEEETEEAAAATGAGDDAGSGEAAAGLPSSASRKGVTGAGGPAQGTLRPRPELQGRQAVAGSPRTSRRLATGGRRARLR